MDIIVLIVLFLLGSAIFGKRKRQSGPPEDTANGEEPMTWEEMERHYGLSMKPRTNEQTTARAFAPFLSSFLADFNSV